jgi:hypothetical protein
MSIGDSFQRRTGSIWRTRNVSLLSLGDPVAARGFFVEQHGTTDFMGCSWTASS